MPVSSVSRVRPFLLALTLLVAAAPSALASSLQRSIEQAIASAGLNNTPFAVVVMDPQTGRTLAEVRPDEQVIPASNMKLLTSGAALNVLGPNYDFRTDLLLQGETLIVRGSGDPGLADPVLLQEMGLDVEDFLAVWVRAVQNLDRPVREIVVDDRAFDREFVHPSWPVEQLNRWYCAEVSGLNFHANVLTLYPTPTREGSAPTLRVQPRVPGVEVENRAITVTTGQNTLWVSRPRPENNFALRGNIRWTPGEPIEVALHDPAMFLGETLRERLNAAGIPVVSVRRVEDEERFPNAEVVAVVRTPMETILRRCNVSSHNLYAEALIKRLAHEVTGLPGSWTAGAAVIRMALQQRVGPADAAAVRVADGSGMSRDNRLTVRILAKWLASFDTTDDVGRAFIESLPRAQEDGTLTHRFRGARLRHEIRAKTGYLRSVVALSGYVTDLESGQRLVFSIIANDYPGRIPVRTVRDAADEIVLLVHDALSTRVDAGQ